MLYYSLFQNFKFQICGVYSQNNDFTKKELIYIIIDVRSHNIGRQTCHLGSVGRAFDS